jgi:hypothetical protein
MGQPHRCLAAWLLVLLVTTALAGPEEADGALACSDQRPNQPQKLRLKAIPNTSSIGALWDPPGNKACVDHFIGKLMRNSQCCIASLHRGDRCQPTTFYMQLDIGTQVHVLSNSMHYKIVMLLIAMSCFGRGCCKSDYHVSSCWQHCCTQVTIWGAPPRD